MERITGGDQTEQFRVQLPNGEIFQTENLDQFSLIEGLSAVTRDFPATKNEIGSYVFGDEYVAEKDSQRLVTLFDKTKAQLFEKGLQIAGEDSFWLEEPQKPDPLAATVSEDLTVRRVSEPIAIRMEAIADNLWGQLSPLDQANLTEEFYRDSKSVQLAIDEFVQRIQLASRGEMEIPSPMDVLSANTYDEKRDMVVIQLRDLLALSVLQPDNAEIRTKFGWGKRMNSLVLTAGGGELGKQIVFDAIEALNDVERALLLSRISMTKRFDLLLVGLDQINEREMAFFINRAVWNFRTDPDSGDLEDIIVTCVERAGSDHQFNAHKIISAILEHYEDGADYIFAQLVKAARQGDFEESLVEFFLSHSSTAKMARQLEDDDVDDIVPWNRRL